MIIPTPNQYGWDNETSYIDFDVSMQTKKYPKAIRLTQTAVGINGITLLGFSRDLYNKNNLSNIVPSKQPKIPRIIHHIWLGGNVPEVLLSYIDSVKKLHPDWKCKLWTDKEAANIKLDNQELYDKATNFGEKSDILRYEILYRYGGVYVDVDMEGLKQLDLLHHCYDFYIGLQPLYHGYHGFVQVGTGIIGSIPGHPILKKVIQKLPEYFHRFKKTTAKTGPILFTRIFFTEADKHETIDIAFPTTYFYPINMYESMKENVNRKKCEQLGAFTIHWWGKTWSPKEFRKKEFQTI